MCMARYFLSLLHSLSQDGSPESRRVRVALIEAVDEYAKAEDKEAARDGLRVRVAGVEAGLSTVLLQSTKKLRDTLAKQLPLLSGQPAIKAVVKETSDALNSVIRSLSLMLQAAERGDTELRARAHRSLDEAKAKLEAIQAKSGLLG